MPCTVYRMPHHHTVPYTVHSQDYERMMEERHERNTLSTIGFAVAFLFDLLDVVAHLVIVVGLLHEYFHVGLHIAHGVLHAVENSGIAIAVVSTVSAAVAELLSLRAGQHGAHGAKEMVHEALNQHATAVRVAAHAVEHTLHNQQEQAAQQQAAPGETLKPQSQ